MLGLAGLSIITLIQGGAKSSTQSQTLSESQLTNLLDLTQVAHADNPMPSPSPADPGDATDSSGAGVDADGDAAP